MNPQTGSCLCGAVRWRVSTLTPLAHCHCSVCRKMHGTAFATYMAAGASDVSFDEGEDQVRVYESSPGFRRAFCGCCGSVVPGVAPDGHRFVPAGGLDADPGVRPKIHLFVASKAAWYPITDTLRQFEAFPDRGGPPALAAERAPAAPLSGSCLCGAVTYSTDAPLQRAQHCHCTRCRKARAAAHATNGFLPIGNMTLQGREHVVHYHVPSAEFFTQAFCGTCGAKVPLLDDRRGIAIIPFGSLDGDPGRVPERHIYAPDRAPWFEISDNLPQLAEQ